MYDCNHVIDVCLSVESIRSVSWKKEKLETYAMKRVAVAAHLPTPWLEPAKRPDDRVDYCLYCSFLPQWNFLYFAQPPNIQRFRKKGKLETNAMKRVAAGAHLPIP